MANYSNNEYDGYSFSTFSSPEDRRVFRDTDDDDAENKEEALLGELGSTDDINNNFDITDDDDDALRPEEFGLKPDTKMKNIYCDKMELYEEIRKYQKDGNPTDKLGEMLIKIALHMSTMARFWRYSHAIKQEIVEHAIYQMLVSVPKFNLRDKKKNPFGYLSMICYRDMLHSLKRYFKQSKITQEAKEVYIRKMSESSPSDERLTALRQLLERNVEYSAFSKNDKEVKGRKRRKSEEEVDMFAISKKDQIKYSRKSAK